jgi:uncharacterized protein with HEPN domain
MHKDNNIYLIHILDCVDKILSYTEGLTESKFLENTMIQDAVIRNFEIIGEATKKLTKEFREENNHIPWKDIAGMRDVLIHDYIGVDLWAVWNTVNDYVPALKREIEKLLEKTA